jgi:4-amino-4-deoxy-L-arabinose transferase-like glycosyltransferase
VVTEHTRRAFAGIWWLPGFIAYAVLRLPSFVEPHWYTDEAGYVSVATSLLRGRALYSQIWNNKPPLHLWTITGVVSVFGPNEAALHALTFISGALTLAAVYWASVHLLGVRRAAVAALAAGLVLGLPIVDAELALPESLLIAPVSWAGALLLVRLDRGEAQRRSRRLAFWPVAVGLLVAAGRANQQTGLAAACVFGLAIALSPLARRRDLLAYVAAVTVPTVAWIGVAVAQAGASRLAFALVGFYVPFTASVFPGTHAGVAVHFAASLAAVVLIGAGALLCRRQSRPAWVLLLWLGGALLIPAFARQPYAHYLGQAVAPAALALAFIPKPRRLRTVSMADLRRRLPQLAGVGLAGYMATVAGLDWIPQAASALGNGTRTLGLYYGGAIGGVLDNERWFDWDVEFDSRVPADAAVAAWLRQKRLTGRPTVLWSSDTWLYSLADLPVSMPTPPIYNDEVLLGNHGQVADYVASLQPDLIIVAEPDRQMFSEIDRLLDGSRYSEVFVSRPYTVWQRAGAAAASP